MPHLSTPTNPTEEARRIVVATTGDSDALELHEAVMPQPPEGHAVVANRAVGVNFIDVYHRTGLYPRPLPFVPGVEGAGVVSAVGADQNGLAAGDRVGYVGAFGSYATHTTVPVDRLIPLPEDVSELVAAAVLLQGITAHLLLQRVHRVQPGDTILVHAAAGGLGLLMCQWAAAMGATVIGVVSTAAKAELARDHGCQYPLVYGDGDWSEQVKAITGGNGVPVVYDSVGRDTFEKSLDCLGTRGVMVSLGQSSGPPDRVDVVALGSRGSLTLTRPSVFQFIETRQDLLGAAEAVFTALRCGHIAGSPRHTYPLHAARQAHRDLEQRRTHGSVVLLP